MFGQTLVFTILGYLILLLAHPGYSRAIHIEGSVTETEVTHFEFIQRLGNPCGIVRLEQPMESTSSSSYSTSDSKNLTQFYQSMIIAVDGALQRLQSFQIADPDLPQCSGVKLDTLPSIGSLSEINEDQLIHELYSSGIFLATHLHLMGLDRQMSVVGVDTVLQDDNIDEHEGLPSWRYLRCGNESSDFMTKLAELTIEMENVLCTCVTSADLNQRASFREPFNKLIGTTFYRYHSSCSSLKIRDCIVITETKNTLIKLSKKFNTLLESHSESGNSNNEDLGYYHVQTNEI